jgi:hypothetical protein
LLEKSQSLLQLCVVNRGLSQDAEGIQVYPATTIRDINHPPVVDKAFFATLKITERIGI